MNKTPLETNSLRSSENTESTRDKINAIIDGTLDPSTVTMAEYLQLCMIAAMNNDILHIEQPVIYGGQYYNVHMCMSKVGPSATLDDALTGTH